MAIYSCSISNVSRAKGSSSCATLSYITASKVYDERTGETYYGFKDKGRVVVAKTMLPEGAPEEYKDPAVLFNALEMYDSASNARPAKKMIVALPRELTLKQQEQIMEGFVKDNLNANGYAAVYVIHKDPKNNNPHGHILSANRQIDKNGQWSLKRKMEYALDEHGERIPLLNPDGTQKVDKQNRKQWKRINAEQNPLDKKEFLKGLREAWATECNKYLDEEHKIDHRSNKDRGLEEEPTIHEGYIARKIEAAGGTAERCQINREIKEKNKLLHELAEQIAELGKKIITAVKEKGAAAHESIRNLLQRSRDARSASGAGSLDSSVGEKEPRNRSLESPGSKVATGTGSGSGFEAGRDETDHPREEDEDFRIKIHERDAKRRKSAAERENRDAEQRRHRDEEARRAEESQRGVRETIRRAREEAEFEGNPYYSAPAISGDGMEQGKDDGSPSK